MAAAVLLRDDFDGPALRRLAKGTKDAAQARRLLALAEIRDGGSRTDAARIGGVGLQTIRDSLPGSVCLQTREGGSALQRPGACRADRRQGAGQRVQTR